MSNERDPKMHETPALTRERSIEKMREAGIPADNARRIAEDTARQVHEPLNRRK